MRFGKFEIDEWVLYILSIVILIGIVSSMSIKLDLEKEKTKQLELQKEIEYYNSINKGEV